MPCPYLRSCCVRVYFIPSDLSCVSGSRVRLPDMKHIRGLLVATLILLISGSSGVRAQETGSAGEFDVLLENLVAKITSIETAYRSILAGNIARTRRLEIFSQDMPEIESIAEQASGRSDENSVRLSTLMQAARSLDPSQDGFCSVLEEMWVRATVLECATRGIGPDIVAEYVRRETASFIMDRGDFTHPGFDQSSLGAQDQVRIYFCGFGLVVLVHMEGGPDAAIQLFRDASNVRTFIGNQLIFRGVDLDINGIPMIEAVLFDEATSDQMREFYFGEIAGKLAGPGSEFGGDLVMSNAWKEKVASWCSDQVRIPDRLTAREQMEFYGIDFDAGKLGPEALLGLTAPVSRTNIEELIGSDNMLEQVAGLDALRWFDVEKYPDDAAALFAVAEPLMSSADFTVAVLAEESFEADARYRGDPYDDSRRERLRTNIPPMCDLMNRALAHPGIEYLSSTAWLDIFGEGSLRDLLIDCIPMVARVITADWEARQAGSQVSPPEGEIELVAYFITQDTAFFDSTSDAVLGFLLAELDSDEVNPFRVWTYVHYLEAAKRSGIAFSPEWVDALQRLKSWADTTASLIRGDELKQALDELMG